MTQENKVESMVIDPFKAAFEKQDAMKKEREEAKNSSGFDFEKIVYEGLAIDVPVVFRILGYPFEFRQSPTDAKLVLQSKMVKDGFEKKVKINWRYIEKKGKYIIDPDWILSKLYNKVMERKFVKYTESDIDPQKKIKKSEDGKIRNDRGFEGNYEDLNTNTKTYTRLKFNQLPTDIKSFGDAYPSSKVVFNIISRMDDWCKKNKHSKLLATKVSTSQKVNDKGEMVTSYFPETGISKSMYDEILVHMRQIGLTSLYTDFIVTRTLINEKYGQNIFDGEGALKLGRGDKAVLGKIVSGDLSEEEKSYELYDLDKLFSVSSYSKLKRDLSGLFKQTDSEFGTNFYDELCQLVIEEEKKREAKKEKETIIKDDEEDDSDSNIETIESKTEKVTTPEIKKDDNKSLDLTTMPFWENLSEEDKMDMKETVVSYTSIDSIDFKPGTALMPCIACSRNLPNTVFHCPMCGTDLA